MKNRYEVIVNVQLMYEFETETPQEAYIESQNIELPHNYVEGSWDTVKIIDWKGDECGYNPQDNEK